jgi:hypothetical protein
MTLQTDTRFPDPDRACRRQFEAQRGLTEEESARMRKRLILILASHFGDETVPEQAVAAGESPSA